MINFDLIKTITLSRLSINFNTFLRFGNGRKKRDIVCDTSCDWCRSDDHLDSYSNDTDGSVDVCCSNLLQERKTRISGSRAREG